MCFSSFFHQKWPKKDIKNEVMQRARQTLLWKRASWSICFAKYRFLVDFGSQGGPNWAPKSIPKRQNRILVPPGGPRVRQGAILAQFWIDFGSILEVFWGLWRAFWHHFGTREVAKSASCNASQKTAANSCKQHKKAANSTKKHHIIENGRKHRKTKKRYKKVKLHA